MGIADAIKGQLAPRLAKIKATELQEAEARKNSSSLLARQSPYGCRDRKN
jgi:hypothetical protein